MTPVFLPHTALDVIDELSNVPLASAARSGQAQLRQLRDMALAKGAYVLLLLWPVEGLSLLAVEVPTDVVLDDASQLIPNLLANPEALEEVRNGSIAGQHLYWLSLSRLAVTVH